MLTTKYARLALAAALLFALCATVSTTTRVSEVKNDAAVSYDGYAGPRKRLQVVQFGVPEKYLKAYPELAEKRIGWGLCNRLVESLYDTRRFEFLEDKQDIIDRVLDAWKLSMSGAVSESTQVKTEGLTGPEFLLYAEVFDFSVGTSQTIVGIAARDEKVTRIGIQIRLVDAASGQYIPASGVGEVTVTSHGTVWAVDEKSFDQSTVGKASQLAINTAVNQMIRRLPF